MILIIDNYDSFTYNLVQYVGEINKAEDNIKVIRNDFISAQEALQLKPSRIIISPGPCTPTEAGESMEIVRASLGKIPLLGVCLGHQAIAQALGGKIIRSKIPFHGKKSLIFHENTPIFKNIENPFSAGRYHSLTVEEESLPSCLKVTARTEDKEIMALQHQEFPYLLGVQFHPESILTRLGKDILNNFISVDMP